MAQPTEILSFDQAAPAVAGPASWIGKALEVGWKHQQAGMLEQAKELYIRVLEQDPKNTDAMYLLGHLAMQSGDGGLALGLLEEAVALAPHHPGYQVLLGNLLQRMGRLDESSSCYLKALAADGTYADAYYNLGNTRERQGRKREAARCFERAAEYNKLHVEARNNLANLYRDEGRYEEAEPLYREAIRLNPNSPMSYSNLGSLYRMKGESAHAAECFESAVRLQPQIPQLQLNLANVRLDQNRYAEALRTVQLAAQLDPNLAEAYTNLANILMVFGRSEDAIRAYRWAVSLNPAMPAIRSALLFGLHYDASAAPEAFLAEHRAWDEHHGKPLQSMIRPHANAANPEKRLRIGYVSGDFRRHSVAFFALPLVLDRPGGGPELFCYSNARKPDDYTKLFEEASDAFVPISGLSDEEAAERIREDGIDILVDLSGHSADNRLGVFARKPAPVQATYIGYPNTTGLAAIDYRFTDEASDPSGLTEKFHSETLVRLDGTFLCYRPDPASPECVEPPSRSSGVVTFGCFNNLAKINRGVLALWKQILDRSAGARLLVKAKTFGEAEGREAFLALASEAGIEASRIVLREFRARQIDHLHAYEEIDIALDSFPYHGTTTTCEALWMGVPVVTLAGRSHYSRVGVSLLNACGHPEWVAGDDAGYVETAVRLASDPAALAALRRGLRAETAASRLCDRQRFASQLNGIYRDLWRKWCDGAKGGTA